MEKLLTMELILQCIELANKEIKENPDNFDDSNGEFVLDDKLIIKDVLTNSWNNDIKMNGNDNPFFIVTNEELKLIGFGFCLNPNNNGDIMDDNFYYVYIGKDKYECAEYAKETLRYSMDK